MLAVERTKDVNALAALLRLTLLGADVCKTLGNAQILQVAGWRTRNEALELKVARAEAVRLAQRITKLDAQIKENTVEMSALLQLSEGRELLELAGIGPVVVAACVTLTSSCSLYSLDFSCSPGRSKR
ncbi:MAG: hypothetical protein HIU81_10710 [Acidobacteria bacterium]|nr:hypothetical protein [Acidobacteriota bacterium]